LVTSAGKSKMRAQRRPAIALSNKAALPQRRQNTIGEIVER